MPTTLSEVHVSVPLTNMLTAYFNNATNFVASKVFPIIQVTKYADKYYEFDRGTLLRQYAKGRAPGGEIPRAKLQLSTGSYLVEQRSAGYQIPEEHINQQDDVLSLETTAVDMLGHQLAMDREIRFVTDFLKTSVWGTDYAGVSSGPTGAQFLQWNDASSDPLSDVRTWKRSIMGNTGVMPNTLTVTRDVHDTLVDNPAVIDRLKGGATVEPGKLAIVTKQQLAALFEINNYYVIDGVYETANEGQTSNPDFVASKKALLTYTNTSPRPVMQAPSAGYHFVAPLLKGANPEGYLIRTGWDDKRYQYLYDGFAFDDQKIVGSDLGAYASAVIA